MPKTHSTYGNRAAIKSAASAASEGLPNFRKNQKSRLMFAFFAGGERRFLKLKVTVNNKGPCDGEAQLPPSGARNQHLQN